MIEKNTSVLLDDILIIAQTQEEHFDKLNQVFTRLVPAGLKNTSVLLDDILIVAQTQEEHFDKLNQVFTRLVPAALQVKLEKCCFLHEKVTYLGHQMDSQGLRTVQSKVDVVKQFPQPTSLEKVTGFLGLCAYYRKFIKNYADTAQPLSSLLKKKATSSWSPSLIKAFETPKEKLTSLPVLIFPGYTKEFLLCADTSCAGLGGTLMQERYGDTKPKKGTTALQNTRL